MSAKKHLVVLSEENRLGLARAARSNKRGALERQRARVLLAAAEGKPDARIARELGVGVSTVAGIRRRFARGAGVGLVRRAVQKKRKARRLDGRAEAHLVALACGAPPQGHQNWTLRLLAGRLVEMQFVDALSHETVRQTLKKTRSSRG